MLERYEPASGVTIPDIDGRVIRGAVAINPAEPYYRARIAEGDLVKVKKIKPAAKKEKGE